NSHYYDKHTFFLLITFMTQYLNKCSLKYSIYFFFNDPTTTAIYTLSLHDALPISVVPGPFESSCRQGCPIYSGVYQGQPGAATGDRKSTRLNSSHVKISYAVFCLKKKKE